jgi:hypothetical protein
MVLASPALFRNDFTENGFPNDTGWMRRYSVDAHRKPRLTNQYHCGE